MLTRVRLQGAGLGPNVKMLPSTIGYTAVEPNKFMHEALSDKVGEHFVAPVAEGESLIVDDIRLVPTGSADVVISTLVLCSVPEQVEMLTEISRVLKDGGTLLFLEHVIEKSQGYPTPANVEKFNWGKALYRELQRAMSPLQGALADGCHSDRDTVAAIAKVFPELYYKRFNVPEIWGSSDSFSFFPIGPQVAGVAIKTPLAYEGQLAEIQFKFCAPEAGRITSLTEQEILSTKGDRAKLARLQDSRGDDGGEEGSDWGARLKCTGREVDKDQQPWFLKKFEKDAVTGSFYKTAPETD